MHNDNKLKDFQLRSGTKQGYSFLELLLNIVLKILANTMSKENKKHTD